MAEFTPKPVPKISQRFSVRLGEESIPHFHLNEHMTYATVGSVSHKCEFIPKPKRKLSQRIFACLGEG